MANLLGKKIPSLVAKSTAGGIRYYWQPSAALKRDGWKPLSLGLDLTRAIRAAEAENARVDAWRGGGAKPREVKRFVQRATVAALIDGYKRSEAFARLADTTKATYSAALGLIERWAMAKTPGDLAAAHITPERVRVLRLALMKPNAAGVVQHHRAHNTLRVGRTLFAWGKRHVEGITANPFEAFDLATPPPRDQIWDRGDVDAFCAAAVRAGYPSMALAVELAEYIGQREGDMLKLQASQYREVMNLDPELRRVLAGADGRVMGIDLRQGKTKRWVGVPVAGEMRGRIEAAIAANARRPIASTHILVSDHAGRPWTKRPFIAKFAEIKARAIAPTRADLAAGAAPHPALAELQFRDLRRTCVVRLGELGLEDALIAAITGHKLASVKRILEVYMPRTTKMAARAVVARIGYRADVDQRAKRA